MIEENEIICIYKKEEQTIDLLHDYNQDSSYLSYEEMKIYNEAKNYMNEIYKREIDIYINDKKIEFNTKYTSEETGQIKVKFIFHKYLTNLSYMFSDCSSLESIDLSSFNTTNVTNMASMFDCCSSLESIDFSSFNTTNVIDMQGMFYGCSSLKSIDLSSFNTTNVINMYGMFYGCSSLVSLDLSSFNTTNVYDMSWMFYDCSSLKKKK